MSEIYETRAREVEKKIFDISGAYQGDKEHWDRESGNPKCITPEIKPLIQEWLIAKGVNPSKVFDASDYVLAGAYKFGDSYINKMKDESPAPQKRTQRRTNHRNNWKQPAQVIDLDEILGERPTEQQTPQAERATPPVQNGSGGEIRTDLLDTTAIVNILSPKLTAIAEVSLGSKVEEFKTQLRELSKQGELNATKAATIEATREAIRELTTGLPQIIKSVASKAIEELLPRKLEITINNEKRVLDAEPRHTKFDLILKWLLAGVNVYIVGPAGTGKSHLAEQLATALDKKLYVVGQSLTKYDVSGYKSPTGEYVGTIARDCIENGGLLFIDEGDFWAAAALGFLNQPLANGYCAFPDKVVQVHKDFQVVICANTYGKGADRQYNGRNPLDAASRDRFAFIELLYDEKMEKQIYGNHPWVSYVHKVRAATTELKMENQVIVSMRMIDKGLRGYKVGLSPTEILQGTLFEGLAEDTKSKILAKVGNPPDMTNIVQLPFNSGSPDGMNPQRREEPNTYQKSSHKEFLAALVDEEKIQAIKILREYTNWSLRGAADYVTDIINRGWHARPTLGEWADLTNEEPR